MPNFRPERVIAIITRRADCASLPRCGDCFEDAFVDQIEELRHHGKHADLALGQRTQKLGRVQGFEIDDARSLHQGQQQIGHLREHVEQWKHAEHSVVGANVSPAKHGLHFTQEIAVSEHDALGVGGGAGSVEQGGEVAGSGSGRFKIPGTGDQDTVEIGLCTAGAVARFVGIQQYNCDC